MNFFRPIVQGGTYRHLAYLALAFPLGTAYFVFLVTAISLGVGLAIIWVGVPILLGVLLAARGLGTLERGLHRSLLGVDIPEPASPFLGMGSLWERVKGLLADSGAWRTLIWLFLRFPAGLFSFVVLVTMIATALALIASPVLMQVNNTTIGGVDVHIGHWSSVGWEPQAVDAWWMVPAGGLLLIISLHVVNGLGWLHGVVGRALLGRSGREREMALEARAVQVEEGARLAHELHDSIGHAMTLMVVQAGAGRKVFDTDPTFARESLEIIERTGRSSLSELDRVLSFLRLADIDAVEPPAPDLGDLEELIGRVREADISVTLTVSGATENLPRELQTTIFRIVQEALTNVMRHAGTATAVSVGMLGDVLEVEIVNDPTGRAERTRSGVGRGLIGIRERVSAYAGESDIGPTPDGGYRVYVRFPLE